MDADSDCSGFPELDDSFLAQAQAALDQLALEYPRLLDECVASMRNCLDEMQSAPQSSEARDRLYILAHDVKGQGTTFGYPLATALGAQICDVLRTTSLQITQLRLLVDALAEVANGGLETIRRTGNTRKYT